MKRKRGESPVVERYSNPGCPTQEENPAAKGDSNPRGPTQEESPAAKGDPDPESPTPEEPIRSGGGIFKYIPEELRCELRCVPGGIRLPYLPPIAPKLSLPVAPAIIPVGIYRDGVPPQAFKNKTTKDRVGRLVFMSSRSYYECQNPYLFGEFGEDALENEVLFHQPFDTRAKREVAHFQMLSEQVNANKERVASHAAAVEKYIRNRRYWEIETVTMLFEKQRPSVIFPASNETVVMSLLEWAPTQDPVLGYGIHKPLPTYDLAEFENAEPKKSQTHSTLRIRPGRMPSWGEVAAALDRFRTYQGITENFRR